MRSHVWAVMPGSNGPAATKVPGENPLLMRLRSSQTSEAPSSGRRHVNVTVTVPGCAVLQRWAATAGGALSGVAAGGDATATGSSTR